MKAEANNPGGKPEPGCNVSSTFNFAAGALALGVAAWIGYLAYTYWWR